MEITYRQEGDYMIPNLEMPEEPEEALTKYGMLRRTFLKEHHSGIYSGKLLSGKLTEHCLTIQKQAEERADRMTEQMTLFPSMAEQDGIKVNYAKFQGIEFVTDNGAKGMRIARDDEGNEGVAQSSTGKTDKAAEVHSMYRCCLY